MINSYAGKTESLHKDKIHVGSSVVEKKFVIYITSVTVKAEYKNSNHHTLLKKNSI
jgi:hypothetical protein